MAGSALPSDVVPSGNTPTFTEQTIPDALQREHKLGEGTWGVFQVLRGKIRFVDLETSEERVVSVREQLTIQPGAPHRVALEGPVEFRIDFFREPHHETPDVPAG